MPRRPDPTMAFKTEALWIPELAELKEILMGLKEDVAGLLDTVANEFNELAAKFASLKDAVEAAVSGEATAEAERDAALAALADLEASVQSAQEDIAIATEQVAGLSEADAEPEA